MPDYSDFNLDLLQTKVQENLTQEQLDALLLRVIPSLRTCPDSECRCV